MLTVKEIEKIISNDYFRREKIIKDKQYYNNENIIKKTGIVPDNNNDPLRTADNRLSHNFHQLLVDEKASYMFTYPVLFDVDNNIELNKKIKEVLGDDFESISLNLCIESSNTGVSWLHYWESDKTFQYDIVKTEEIIPVYSESLKKELIGIYRYYEICSDSKIKTIIEYWTNNNFIKYTLIGSIGSSLKFESSEEVEHSFETVPFIAFYNNRQHLSDLYKYKDQIDLYDKVMSGFANDLEDIQQVIYILENYGGADLKEFTRDLKRYKTIQTESGSGGTGGGVKTLQIEIPVEARNILLEILKKQIYESGQGLQQDSENFGNASGVALKFFYRKLELKSGFTEIEFKKGFSMLIRAILKYIKANDKVNITQTYTRNMISNDVENSEIAKNSLGIIPKKLILRNHPWVDDPEEAEKLLLEEDQQLDPYEDLAKNKDTLNE